MTISPLSWPSGSPPGGWISDTVPLIGRNKRIWNALYVQMNARDEESCLSLWTPMGRKAVRVQREIGEATQEIIGWPKSFLIPDDPCVIAFWSPSEDKVEAHVGTMFDRYPTEAIYGYIDETVGELVESICACQV